MKMFFFLFSFFQKLVEDFLECSSNRRIRIRWIARALLCHRPFSTRIRSTHMLKCVCIHLEVFRSLFFSLCVTRISVFTVKKKS